MLDVGAGFGRNVDGRIEEPVAEAGRLVRCSMWLYVICEILSYDGFSSSSYYQRSFAFTCLLTFESFIPYAWKTQICKIVTHRGVRHNEGC